MSLEKRPFTGELRQVTDKLTHDITALTQRVAYLDQNPLPIHIRMFERVASKVPWFKDTQTRTQAALDKAKERLATLQTIQGLDVEQTATWAWSSDITVCRPGFYPQNYSLTSVVAGEHPRSSFAWRYFEASIPWSVNRLKFPEAQALGQRYGWIVEAVLQQRKLSPKP
jgi:hypothetical protein